jgi:hypothetical protein
MGQQDHPSPMVSVIRSGMFDHMQHFAITRIPSYRRTVPHVIKPVFSRDHPRIRKAYRVSDVGGHERFVTVDTEGEISLKYETPNIPSPVTAGRALPAHE